MAGDQLGEPDAESPEPRTELRKSSPSWPRCKDTGACHRGVSITRGAHGSRGRGDGVSCWSRRRWGWDPRSWGTHPVPVPGARCCPQLHATEDPVLAVKQQVQQVQAVQAAHAGGHGCEVTKSGPQPCDHPAACPQGHPEWPEGACLGLWGVNPHAREHACRAGHTRVQGCVFVQPQDHAVCEHVGTAGTAPRGRESTCRAPTASFQLLKLLNPLFFPPREPHSSRLPSAPSSPTSCPQAPGQDARPEPGQVPRPALSLRVAAPKGWVNHFGWQVEGEETAATQPRGGDTALGRGRSPAQPLPPRAPLQTPDSKETNRPAAQPAN